QPVGRHRRHDLRRHGLGSARLGAGGGRGGGRVLGPDVTGIAPLHLGFHRRPGAAPEARQLQSRARHGGGAEGGGRQVAARFDPTRFMAPGAA
ncbi:hypothetical protein WDZ92_47325, partial [Nostoc sp. NIES-2111]